MNKWEILGLWLSDYEPLNNWIYFNALRNEDGLTAFNSVPTDRSIKEYIDGSIDAEMIFSIDMIKGYDVEMSTTNYEAIEEIDNFKGWLENKDDMPNFGDNVTILDFEVVTGAPTIMVDTENQLAQYQFQCKITYHEESEE